jgi:hypothetical protein
VLLELAVALIVVAPDSGVLEGAVHPLDPAVGPRMLRLGEPMLDVVLASDAVEAMQAISSRRA